MISVLILTKNEENDLPACLASVSWCDDIHVYDSLSDDRTVEIAKGYGAKVTQRSFDNWASHQNWGVRNIHFKHKWVFYIDADERMTPELVAAVKSAANDPGEYVAFRLQRRDFWGKAWLKHVQTSQFYIRMFMPNHVSYERLVNPITVIDGPVGNLDGYLNHFPFSKGMSHWMARHNSYSTLEAQQIISNRKQGGEFSIYKAFFEKDFNVRRYHQKELFYRLPARPVVKFLILYFLKFGILDGVAGFRYAVLQAVYEYMIVLKVQELDKM